jgi:transcription elongation GreA/GreB family factor
VRQKESNKILYFKIAVAEVSNDDDDKIIEVSKNSPIGTQLLNKKEEDTVTVGTPSGTFHYKILKVTTIHDLL